MMQKIKKYILNTGALLLVCSALMPVTAAAQVDIQGATCSGSDIKITANPSNDACKNVDEHAAGTANHLARTIINIMTVLVGILAVIMIIFAGFRYVTSGGSDDAVKGAKNTILYAVVGLVVVSTAQIIVHFVINKTEQASFPCTHNKVQGGPNSGGAC
jgi:hypothetical protein